MTNRVLLNNVDHGGLRVATGHGAAFGDAINLLNESLRTYARDENELWYAQELDRRFLLGARYRF